MSNYSEESFEHSLQVIDYGSSQEIIGSGDEAQESTIHKALENIFSACDKNESGYALVSDLIKFITPHMQSHMSKLMTLQKALDPNEIDPLVDSITFFKVMNDWTTQVLAESPELSYKQESVGIQEEETHLNTPIAVHSNAAMLVCDAINNTSDTVLGDCSNVYVESFAVNNESDLVILQEHIKQMEHQNRKLIHELENTRSQLTLAEEQNETFQADLERISRRLISEQQINAQLEKDRHATADLLEASNVAQKQIGKLEKHLASTEKQLIQFNEAIGKLEDENKKLEDKLNRANEREGAVKQQILVLQNEICAKERDISSLEETNTQLKINLEEQQHQIEENKNISLSLKIEKEKLEECLHRKFKNHSLSCVTNPSRSCNEYFSIPSTGTYFFTKHNDNTFISENYNFNPKQYVSPFNKILQNNTFNSPKLCHMLANPVSPSLDNDKLFNNKNASSKFGFGVKATSTPEFVKKCNDQIFSEEKLISASCGSLKGTPSSIYHSCISNVNTTLETKHIPYVNRNENSFKIEEEIKEEDLCSYHATKNSSPTVYFLEPGALKQKCKTDSTSSMNTSIFNGMDNSSDDDGVWKMQMVNYSPHESLEAELSQVEKNQDQSKSKNSNSMLCGQQNVTYNLKCEYGKVKEQVENLNKENNQLRSQLIANEEKYKHTTIIAELKEYEALKIKFQQLEIDNNNKYIKIIDLMEQKELLENKVYNISNENNNEFQTKLSKLQNEKDALLEAMEKIRWEKNESETTAEELQLVKNKYEVLQNQLVHFRTDQEKLSQEFGKISSENIELKTDLNDLIKKISELTKEKIDLCSTITKLENNIKSVNEKTQVTNKINESQVIINQHLEEIKVFKDKLAEYQKTVETLNQKVTELTVANSKLTENLNETESQTTVLRQIINHQNDNLKVLENEKESIINELYNQKDTCNKLSDDNKDLAEKLECALNKLCIEQDAKQHIGDLNIELTEKLESVASELYKEKCKNSNISDEHSQIIEGFQNDIKQLQEHNNNLSIQLEASKSAENPEGIARINTEVELESNIPETNIGDANLHLSSYHTDLLKNLDIQEKEVIDINNQLKQLPESRLNLTAEYEMISCAYNKLRITNSKILMENELLSDQRNLLVNKLEQLGKDYNEIKGLKESIDQLLFNITTDTQDFHKEINDLEKIPTRSNIEQTEIGNLLDTTGQQNTSLIIRGKMNELENKYGSLKIDHDKLQRDLESVRRIYENLSSEKEEWVMEKANLQQILDEHTIKVAAVKDNEQSLLQELNRSGGAAECNSCTLLKEEIKQMSTKMNKLDDNGGNKNSNTSYNKLQIKIERLKNDFYTVEEQLKSERQQNLFLGSENNRLKNEIQVNLKCFNEEKINFDATISLLKDEMNKIENEHEKQAYIRNIEELQEKLNTVTTTRDVLIQENDHLKVKAAKVIQEKVDVETTLEEVQKEISYFKLEIEDLTYQKSNVEDRLQKMEFDMKSRTNLEQQPKDQLESMIREVNTLKDQIQDLKNQKNDVEKKLEKCQNSLRQSEDKIMSLRRELTDIQSLHGNDVLKNTEFTDLEKLAMENNNLKLQSKHFENDLIELKIKLCDSSNYMNILSDYVRKANQKLSKKRLTLNRYTLTVISCWHDTFESIPDTKPFLDFFHKGEPEESLGTITGPLDEELFKLEQQIKVTSMLFDSFVILKLPLIQMYTQSSEIQQAFVTEPSSMLTQKFIKKFTLKSSCTPSSSPASGNPPIEHDIDSRLFENTNMVLDDGVNCKAALYSSTDESGDCDDLETFTVIDEEVKNGLFNDKLALEMISPSFSDNILEELNLLNEKESPMLNIQQMEEKVKLLVPRFLIDIATIKERHQSQKIHQDKLRILLSQEIKKHLIILTKMSLLSKNVQITQLVKMSTNQVHVIVTLLSQMLELAVQCGALLHERRFLKVTNLMINYAASLKQKAETVSHQLKFISSRNLQPHDTSFNSISNSESLQSKEISSVSISSEQNNVNSQVISNKTFNSIQSQTEEVESSELHSHLSTSTQSSYRRIILSSLFIFVTAIVIFAATALNFISIRGYPWRWVSWDDIISPFIQQVYLRGPPPI